MKWTLKRVFIAWFVFMVVILAFTMPESRPIDLDEVSFHTTESSELYFKNVRSFFYEIWDDPKSGFVHYRIKSRNGDSLVPSINFMILNNWRFDEAYVMAEGNGALSTLEGLTLSIVTPEDSSTFTFDRFTNYEHWMTAGRVYMALRDDRSRFWLSGPQGNALGREALKIYTESEERKSLRKTLGDYFKLVGKIYCRGNLKMPGKRMYVCRINSSAMLSIANFLMSLSPYQHQWTTIQFTSIHTEVAGSTFMNGLPSKK